MSFTIWPGLYLEFVPIFSFFSALFWVLEATSETKHFVQLSCLCSWVLGVKRVELNICNTFKIDKIKFEANSHFRRFSASIFVKNYMNATSHSSGVMVNTTFSVMDKAIQGFKPSLNLCIRIVLN